MVPFFLPELFPSSYMTWLTMENTFIKFTEMSGFIEC